jgi:hypothetical protein
LLDWILKKIYLRTKDGKWFSSDELREIVRSRGLSEDDSDIVINFLTEYFLVIGLIGVQLNSWVCALFEASL